MDRRVTVSGLGEIGDRAGGGPVGVHDELPRHPRVLVEGLDGRCQSVNRCIPGGFLIAWLGGAHGLHGGQVGAAQDVEQHPVMFAEALFLILTLEYQRAFGPAVRVIEETLRQMRREIREIGPALIGVLAHAIRQLIQAGGAVGFQREGFLPGGIVQHHGRPQRAGGNGLRNGLLIEQLHARLSADGRAVVTRCHEGFAKL